MVRPGFGFLLFYFDFHVREKPSCKEETDQEELAAGRKRKKQTSGGGKAKKKKDGTSQEPNIFDMTWIHPESYDIADK